MTKRFDIKNNLDFKKKFSTAHAVISLIGNIEKAINKRMFVGRVFVNLQKPFDTVDPNIFLLKLTRYGIRDQKTICNN